MTRYMLDTNIISDLIRNPQGKAAKRIAKVGEDNICTSIVVAAELRYGCVKNGSKRLLKAVEDKTTQHLEIYDHLGDVLMALNEREAALAAWRKGIEVATDSRRDKERKAAAEKKLEKNK